MSDTIQTLKAAKALIDMGLKHSAIEAINTVIEALRALQSGEAVVFTCHGNNAPAYGCNKPGDMSGTYYRAPQPVVEGLDFDFIAAVLEDYCFLQTSGIIAPANRYATSDVNEQVALLSAGKENNNE